MGERNKNKAARLKRRDRRNGRMGACTPARRGARMNRRKELRAFPSGSAASTGAGCGEPVISYGAGDIEKRVRKNMEAIDWSSVKTAFTSIVRIGALYDGRTDIVHIAAEPPSISTATDKRRNQWDQRSDVFVMEASSPVVYALLRYSDGEEPGDGAERKPKRYDLPRAKQVFDGLYAKKTREDVIDMLAPEVSQDLFERIRDLVLQETEEAMEIAREYSLSRGRPENREALIARARETVERWNNYYIPF